MSNLAKQLGGQSQAKCYAKGGVILSDAKQGKSLTKKMAKEDCGCKAKKGKK